MFANGAVSAAFTAAVQSLMPERTYSPEEIEATVQAPSPEVNTDLAFDNTLNTDETVMPDGDTIITIAELGSEVSYQNAVVESRLRSIGFFRNLGHAPLLNLKTPREMRALGTDGKSRFTTLDRRKWVGRLGKLDAGVKFTRGNIGRDKYVGRLGTLAWGAGAFSAGYGGGAALMCANDCFLGD